MRMQLLRHSETALPKRRKFDHLAALLAVVRHVPSVHEPLVHFAPVGDGAAHVLSAPERLPAQRNEHVWNLPKHVPFFKICVDGHFTLRAIAVELHDPDWSVRRGKEGQPLFHSVRWCGDRTKDTRRLAVNWGIGDIKSNSRTADSTRRVGYKVGKPDSARSLPLAPAATRGLRHDCLRYRRAVLMQSLGMTSRA